MNTPRVRWAALGGLIIGLLVSGLTAHENVPRLPPTRPGASAVAPATPSSPKPKTATASPAQVPRSTRFGATDWVEIGVAAKRLGLKVSWTLSSREAVLTDKDTRLELASDRLEAGLNGDRIFLGQAPVSRSGNLYVSKIDLERCLVPLVRPALLGAPKSVPKTIVIDPGHGGPDTGKVNGALGLFEKTFTLDTSLRLKKILEARGWKVVLTRSDDRQLKPGKQDDLQRRAQIADEVGADVFVSIHFNSVAEQVEKVSGAEVYRFTPQHQPPVTRAQRRLDDEVLNPGNATYRQQLAEAIAQGLGAYASQLQSLRRGANSSSR